MPDPSLRSGMRAIFYLSLASLVPLVPLASLASCSAPSVVPPPPAPNDGGAQADGGAAPDAATDGGQGQDSSAQQAMGWPVIASGGGAVMSPLEIVTIVSLGDVDQDALFSVGDAVAASRWWASFAGDYGLSTVTHTKWTGAGITATSVSDVEMIAYMKATIQANGGHAPDAHTLYLLYLPDGTNSSDATSGEVNTDCKSTSGYHTMTADGMIWAVVERCPVAYLGWTKLMGVTQTATHEIVEAATDPDTAFGWNVACAPGKRPWECFPLEVASGTNQGEVGDLCSDTLWSEAGLTWTRVWSKTAAAKGGDPCVPAVSAPYYDVGTPQDWYALAPGQSLDVPVTGVVDHGTLPDWTLYADVASESPKGVFSQMFASPTIGVGQTRPLTLKAAAAAPSGSYAVVRFQSFAGDALHMDPIHAHYVGVYVP
jgi:hypothetical protein